MNQFVFIALALGALSCTSNAPKVAAPATRAPSAFEQARDRLKGEVARVYGRRVTELKITPASADVVGFEEQDLGELRGFEVSARELRVRGFSSTKEAVLLKQGELGPLFRAAHALDAATALPAPELAARVVWLIGPDHRLLADLADYPRYPLPPDVTLPSWERHAGVTVLHFFYLEDDLHGGPATSIRAEVRCTSDYKAALSTSLAP
jgi:hypothetical protein